MGKIISRIFIRIFFHSNGRERHKAKKILDAIDRTHILRRPVRQYFYPESKLIQPVCAPPCAKTQEPMQKKQIPAAQLRLTVVTMVRNEQARIHDCMRHLCALFDRVVVIDHHSDDNTARIALGYQGHSKAEVIVLRGEDAGKYQAEYMTACANALIKEGRSDWIFFLDIDEFLPFQDAQSFRQTLVNYAEIPLICMYWRNIALNQFDPDTVQGVAGIMGPASHFRKVAVNVAVIGQEAIIVSQGNHNIQIPGLKTQVRMLPAFDLYHVPVLGKEALKRKVEQGVRAYRNAIGKAPNMGFHLREMSQSMDAIMSDDALLRGIAINYSIPIDTTLEKIATGTIMQGCQDVVIDIAQIEKSVQTMDCVNVPTFDLMTIDKVMASTFPCRMNP